MKLIPILPPIVPHISVAHKVSELDKQKEEEAKILHSIKEASALMSVAEIAKGVIYTEPLVTGLVQLIDVRTQLCVYKYHHQISAHVQVTCSLYCNVGGVLQDIFVKPQRVKITELERSGIF